MSHFFDNQLGSRKAERLQLGRRKLLLASLSAPFVLSHVAYAQQGAQGESFTRFMAVSSRLSGYATLDRQLGTEIFRSLSTTFLAFESAVAALATQDDETLGYARVAKVILKAWYLGVIEHGEKSSCIAYISTLQVRVVADVLRPPSYAYGPYGSWHKHPIAS